MAGVRINTKVKASSLFETIVALMVIMLVFGLSMTMYVNIMRNSTSLAELKASQKLEEIAKDTKIKKSYFDEKFEDEGVDIEKTITPYQENAALLLLKIEAFDKNRKQLAERKEIIINDTND